MFALDLKVTFYYGYNMDSDTLLCV